MDMLRRIGDRAEQGATAIFVAAALLLLMGMAAIAIDVGAGFNERRQNQTAADVAALAGALENLGDDAAVRGAVFELVADNLTRTYSPTDWQAQWESCMDTERADFNSIGFLFTPVDAPATWSAATIDCISIDPRGYVRVRVPDQLLDTTFGRVLGVSQLTTQADAIARVLARGVGGVIPFGISADQPSGEQVCLSSSPTGLSEDPCAGSDSGNFGTLKARIFGDPAAGIPANCNVSPLPSALAQNIAAGVDHPLFVHPTPVDPGLEILDECFNSGVDTLNTDVGFPNNGAEEGLATGPVCDSAGNCWTPLLQQPHTDAELASLGPLTRTVNAYDLDDTPLWYFLRTDLVGDSNGRGRQADDQENSVPASCLRRSFLEADISLDWDMGGGLDPPRDYNDDLGDLTPTGEIGTEDVDDEASWEHMLICFQQYLGDIDLDGVYEEEPYTDTPLFESGLMAANAATYGLVDSPRFAYVPRFHETDLGTGSSWLHIRDFQPVFIQGTWWKKANQYLEFHPGEPCAVDEVEVACGSVSGYSMIQMTAIVIPDEALPLPLRGDPLPNEELSPYDVELYR